ncbi:MAG TPA: hypothetical protein VN802_23775 [Stellaceae bacterium]|nr:hypothetical protein [Stellaceae bacterium]
MATKPAIWSRVRLELARSHDYPEGSTRHGYVLVLPLDGAGRIDEAARHKAPQLCTLHRFWEGEGDSVGQVVRTGQGRWAFSYHAGREDDEPVPHLSDHVFRAGEYLAVRESGGAEHAFRIVAVEPAPGLAHLQPS